MDVYYPIAAGRVEALPRPLRYRQVKERVAVDRGGYFQRIASCQWFVLFRGVGSLVISASGGQGGQLPRGIRAGGG